MDAHTTTIARQAKRLRPHPSWRGRAGEMLKLDYFEKAIGRLIKEHPDLIGSKLTEHGLPPAARSRGPRQD